MNRNLYAPCIMYTAYRNSVRELPRVRRTQVPDRAHDLAALARVDYADAFAVRLTDATTPPAEWLRAVTASMPELFALVRVAHRALGLHLAAADSDAHII